MTKSTREKLGLWVTFAVGVALIMAAFGALIQNKLEHMRPDPIAEMGDFATYYQANVDIDVKAKQADGKLTVHAKNDTGAEQEAIYFHLYPNRFANDAELSGEAWTYVLGESREPGSIEVSGVKVDGEKADASVDGTILKIPVPDDGWTLDEVIEVSFDFDIRMPKNNGRFSYDEHAVWFGNWLPIRAVYDPSGWNLDPYYPIGDPFNSDTAKYKVNVKLPKGWKLASTATDGEPDGRTYKLVAENVRDFAMAAMDETYVMQSERVGDTIVRTWRRATDSVSAAGQIHASAAKSLAYFSDKYGVYPYEEYDVVRTGGFFGGMEYPGLVFIEGSAFEQPAGFGIVSTAHETAHQWWYGIVGSDEVDEPWLDESLANYSTIRFLLDEFPGAGEAYLAAQRERAAEAAASGPDDQKVAMPVHAFADWFSYGGLVYGKGALIFYELEQMLGIERMEEALAKYWAQYKFRNVTGEQLLNVIEQEDAAAADKLRGWLKAPASAPIE